MVKCSPENPWRPRGALGRERIFCVVRFGFVKGVPNENDNVRKRNGK